MARPRWRKLVGDLRAAWGRVLVMQIAIAIALAGVGTVLAARAVLGREIVASYRATAPADATLELADGVDAELLAAVRARPEVAAADRRQMIRARIKAQTDAPWQMLVLFVADDFNALTLNTFRPDTGAWPPPRGSILVERTAVALMGRTGPTMIVQTPHGAPMPIAIAGTVHDAGQAPNWQEHRGCAYATIDTLGLLGEKPVLHDLLVQFRDVNSVADVDAQARALASWLRERGHDVHEIRVPKLRQHPHQGLMNASQLVLLMFTILLLVLAAIVLATILATILARQTREIGVMKAVGASTRQLAALYGAFVVGLGAIAVAVAVPLAYFAAHAMIDKIAFMMNITLADSVIPVRVYVTLALLGMLVPLAIAAIPILRATRVTVRESFASHGAAFARPALARLPVPLRNALRRPGRLALTIALLVIGGSLVLTASNLQRSLMAISSKIEVARSYDLEVRLDESIDAVPHVAGVRAAEAWSAMDAARGDIVRTYPDGGHGSFTLAGLPPGGTTLVQFPLKAGRWLVPGDVDGVVLGSHGRTAQIGERITIAVAGKPTTWTVVGLVEEIGGGSAFVTHAGYVRATGDTGTSLLRIATAARSDAERAAILAELETALAARGAAVRYAMPTPLLRSIIDDHVALVVRAVILMAALLALVGLIGLGSAMAINVAERTREIAIMKTIGASDRRLVSIIIGEAAAVGALAAVIAITLSVPLTLAVIAKISANGFLANPPLTLSYGALVVWPLILIAGAALASLLPARRAARLTVASAIAEI